MLSGIDLYIEEGSANTLFIGQKSIAEVTDNLWPQHITQMINYRSFDAHYWSIHSGIFSVGRANISGLNYNREWKNWAREKSVKCKDRQSFVRGWRALTRESFLAVALRVRARDGVGCGEGRARCRCCCWWNLQTPSFQLDSLTEEHILSLFHINFSPVLIPAGAFSGGKKARERALRESRTCEWRRKRKLNNLFRYCVSFPEKNNSFGSCESDSPVEQREKDIWTIQMYLEMGAKALH